MLVNQKNEGGMVTIKTLATVGDNNTASVKFDDLIRATDLTLGDNTEASRLLERPARWTVIKHNGVPYVRGILAASLSPGALRLGNVTIANQAGSPTGAWGASPTPIDVRMDKIAGIMDNM